jgi:hypothetical protein
MGESRNAYGILVRKPKAQTGTGKLRRKGENNIKMTFKEIGWKDVNRIRVAYGCRLAWGCVYHSEGFSIS